jgi:PTS system nitrogen regulatory IIA component
LELTIESVARFFDVSAETIDTWIRERHLPARRMGDQFRFNREELLEWATATGTRVVADIIASGQLSPQPTDLAAALTAGGIHYTVSGVDKRSVLGALTACWTLPPAVDRTLLLEVLLAREALGSTGMGNGVAIPHPRNPIVLNVRTPLVALFFLENPVDFQAVDELPVHTLFALICPNVRIHLQLLSRLAFMLHDAGFNEKLQNRAASAEILAAVRQLEQTLAARPKTVPAG